MAAPPLGEDYESYTVSFHALWARHGSDVDALSAALPDAEGWRAFLVDWGAECESPAVWDAGVQRAAALEASAAVVRETLASVLEDFGAYERGR